MRVYLDTCAIQRPLDDLSQLRVRVEAEAVLAVVTAAESGGVDVVASDVLRFETENNPLSHRRDFGRRVLRLATSDVETDQRVSARAVDYERAGIKPLDAVHLASAVEAEADYFCTADDALLRDGKRANTEQTRLTARTHRPPRPMNAPARPLAEVTDRAFRALAREIGVADTARFLQQFGAGRGDYTKERDALFGHLSLDEIVEQSKRYSRQGDE